MALQEGDRRDDEGQGGEGCVGPLPAPTCDAVQGHNPATNPVSYTHLTLPTKRIV